MDERTRRNLFDAGCSEEFVSAFGELGSASARLAQLRSYRRYLLSSVHAEQKKLECLDYLMCKMRSEEKEQENG